KTIIAGRMKEVERSIRIMQELQEKPKDSPQSKKREIKAKIIIARRMKEVERSIRITQEQQEKPKDRKKERPIRTKSQKK
ncbi:4397_t:CDS:2, partial [Cetraspora pellucida]